MNDDPGGLIKELGAPVIILNELFRQDATKEVVGSASQARRSESRRWTEVPGSLWSDW